MTLDSATAAEADWVPEPEPTRRARLILRNKPQESQELIFSPIQSLILWLLRVIWCQILGSFWILYSSSFCSLRSLRCFRYLLSFHFITALASLPEVLHQSRSQEGRSKHVSKFANSTSASLSKHTAYSYDILICCWIMLNTNTDTLFGSRIKLAVYFIHQPTIRVRCRDWSPLTLQVSGLE